MVGRQKYWIRLPSDAYHATFICTLIQQQRPAVPGDAFTVAYFARRKHTRYLAVRHNANIFLMLDSCVKMT